MIASARLAWSPPGVARSSTCTLLRIGPSGLRSSCDTAREKLHARAITLVELLEHPLPARAILTDAPLLLYERRPVTHGADALRYVMGQLGEKLLFVTSESIGDRRVDSEYPQGAGLGNQGDARAPTRSRVSRPLLSRGEMRVNGDVANLAWFARSYHRSAGPDREAPRTK